MTNRIVSVFLIGLLFSVCLTGCKKEVSASRNGNNGVQAVVVKARRSIPLQLMNPWKGQRPTVTNLTTGKTVRYNMDKSNGECIVFNAEAGHTYSFDI